MKLLKKLGKTSQILQVFIQDSSSTIGAGLTGLVFNSGSLTAYFHRDTDTTATAITLVTMTIGTFTSSGFKEIDATNMPGWYQFCPPNTVFASGAESVGLHLKGAANMAPLAIEIQLTGVDVDSAATFMTGVNGVAPPTNWNLTSIDGNGRLDIIKIAGTTQAAADLGTLVPAIKAKTDPLTYTVANQVDSNVITKTGFSLSAAGIQAIWDALTSALTTVGSIGKRLADDIDATVSSRLASASYTAPDNTSIAAIKVITDQITFSSGAVVSAITSAGAFAQAAADKVWSTAARTLTAFGFTVTISAGSVQAIWDALTSTMTTAGSIGKKLADWVLGSDSKVLLSTDAQTGVTIPTVTNLTAITGANTELTAVPTSTASLKDMWKWMFLLSRNKITQTSSVQTALANDSVTAVATAAVSDDGTTAVRGLFS